MGNGDNGDSAAMVHVVSFHELDDVPGDQPDDDGCGVDEIGGGGDDDDLNGVDLPLLQSFGY